MVMTSTTIRYVPVVHTDEIRLLILHSGLPSSPIRCSLIHVRLKAVTTPVYDALSYAWGTEHDTNAISMNGAGHMVRKNLYLALQNLRLPNDVRVLWIDALCINQLDDRERGHQGKYQSISRNQNKGLTKTSDTNGRNIF